MQKTLKTPRITSPGNPATEIRVSLCHPLQLPSLCLNELQFLSFVLFVLSFSGLLSLLVSNDSLSPLVIKCPVYLCNKQ